MMTEFTPSGKRADAETGETLEAPKSDIFSPSAARQQNRDASLRPFGEVLRDLVPPGILKRIEDAVRRHKAKYGGRWLEEAWASAGCSFCEGSGVKDGKDCTACHGNPAIRPCATCRGAGVVLFQSKLADCPSCNGSSRIRHERILGASNIPERARSWRFADYPPAPENKGQTKAWAIGLEFVERQDGWLHIFGPAYTGKTFLSLLIANALIDRNRQAAFRPVPSLLGELKDTFRDGTGVTYSDIWQTMLNIPFLVLDDYGRENPTPWVNERMFELINHRWENMFCTIITTNFTLPGLERVNERLAARVQDTRRCTLIHLSQRLVPAGTS